MGMREGRLIHQEKTELGDVAKSLQGLIETQFMSKNHLDVVGATRFDKLEVQLFAIANINRVIAKIYSLSENDIDEKNLKQLNMKEQQEIKELWALKKRFMKNPMALSYAVYDAWMKMYALGLQSLNGMSRLEGTEISGGATERLMNSNEVGMMDKLKKFISGNVMYKT